MRKLKLILSMVCCLALGLATFQTNAQPMKKEVPPSFSVQSAQALPAQAYVNMPVNFSVSELLSEDEFNRNNGIDRPRIAQVIPTNLTMENSGAWTELSDGSKIWRLAVEAKNAKALIISYDEFYLPEDSRLFIYNADKTHVLASFDSKSNKAGREYSTPFVAGDVAILEYVAPSAQTRDEARIKISGIGYGYNHIHIVPQSNYELQLSPGAGGDCQVNVICSPEGDDWQAESNSICQMTMLVGTGWYICSGTLVNNTANDGIPYIISAHHCYDGASDANLLQWQFYFFYRSQTCSPSSGYDTDIEMFTGATLVTAVPQVGGSDGLLLRLVQDIPAEWVAQSKITYSGWDRRDAALQSGAGLHHPSGDMQKISTYTSPAERFSWTNGAINAHWKVTSAPTENGRSITLGGSSGSALFNQNKLLVGTLTGGYTNAACGVSDANHGAMYGSLFFHWDRYGSTPATQMKTWLDPVGGGTAETCASMPSEDLLDFRGTPTNIYALEQVKFISFAGNMDSIRWEFPGADVTTATERIVNIQYSTPGVYDVRLHHYTSDTAGAVIDSVVEKLGYITVTLRGETPVQPVANFISANETVDFYSDDVMTATLNDSTYATPPTVIRVGAAGDSTATYNKELIAGTATDAQINNQLWIRTNTGYTSSRPTATGAGGSGDYYYCFYPVRSGQLVRMFNREVFDLSQHLTAKLKFKYITRNYHSTFLGIPLGDYTDGFRIEYRSSSTGSWETIYEDAGSTDSNLETYPNWVDIELDLPNLSADYQIAFVGLSNGGYGVGIDDINVTANLASSHVTIWEGDAVEYSNLATGPPVLYKYDFEGGTPATSTSSADRLTVRYDSAGLYSSSQWVKNTIGEDSINLEDYVTVLKRNVTANPDTIKANCNDSISAQITLTANKDWTATFPDWLTVSPTSGTVTTPGTDQDFIIDVSLAANNSHEARATMIIFEVDGGKGKTVVEILQATPPVPGLTVQRYDSVNAQISWNRVPGMQLPEPPQECDMLNAGRGDFETTPLLCTTYGSWILYANPSYAHSGNRAVVSMSSDVIGSSGALQADNWLVTPKLKVTAEKHTLSYWMRQHNASTRDQYEVRLSTSSTVTAVTDFTDVIRAMVTEGTTDYTRIDIDLSAYEGQEVYIAFHHQDYNKYAIYLDDVSGLDLADCEITQRAALSLSSTGNFLPLKTFNSRGEGNVNSNRLQQLVQMSNNNLSAANNSEYETQRFLTPTDVASLAELRWCGKYNTNGGVGLGGAAYKIAAKWTALEAKKYTGAELKAIEIAVNAEAGIELFVMEDGEVIYTQAVPQYELRQPLIVELDQPVILSGNKEIMIGYSIAEGYSGYPTTVDAGLPAVDGKGNLLYDYETDAWYTLIEIGGIANYNYNWYIVGHVVMNQGFNVYRQRSIDGVPTEEPQLIASGLSVIDTVYNDVDIRPGGEYCYWVTYKDVGVESCPNDTSCVFILYQQEIAPIEDIIKEYGAPAFKYDKAGTDYLLESNADSIDFFSGRTLPVTLEIIDGISVGLSGVPSDYTAALTNAGTGVTNFRAIQTGIADTLLAADTVYFSVTTTKKDLYVKAADVSRLQGEDNPVFTFEYDSFVYGEDSTALDVLPIATCVATRYSPVGEYAIVVHVEEDRNYNLIPDHTGKLTVLDNGIIANAFTPYELDGYNDQFMPGRKIQVFNRYGVLIYDSRTLDEINGGWNGYNRKTGKLVDPGVYYYVEIDQINGKVVRTGSVTVMKN